MSATARKIAQLLHRKHAKDLRVVECPVATAYSKGDEYGQIDFLAIPRSWARWGLIGYEIKVSRADWVCDQKWEAKYLPPCARFSIVAPAGVVDPQELPRGVGLLVVSKNGERLWTKRKAAVLEVDRDAEWRVMAAILINRARVGDAIDPQEERAARMARLVNQIEQREALGRLVRTKISSEIRSVIDSLEGREKEVATREAAIANVRERLAHHGIDIDVPNYRIASEVDRVVGALPRSFADTVSVTINNLEKILEALSNGGRR